MNASHINITFDTEAGGTRALRVSNTLDDITNEFFTEALFSMLASGTLTSPTGMVTGFRKALLHNVNRIPYPIELV